MPFLTLRDDARAALLGLAVGDALGVPVEFRGRDERRRDPVTGMRAYGTHRQPAGTWSDDASLSFCLAETLARPGALAAPPDLTDFARRCTNWLDHGYWTAHGSAFDVGNATRDAIGRLRRSIGPPEQAGSTHEDANGNGALMRILPLVFHQTWRHEAVPLAARWALTQPVCSVTHGHVRSTVGCFLYLLLARELLAGRSPVGAYEVFQAQAAAWLADPATLPPARAEARQHYAAVLDGSLLARPEHLIASSGYVVHTLEAALWCLLRHDSYAATVLAAVNLGDDTDTTGAVVGGLAGMAYGEAGIPPEWRASLARRADIEALAERLAAG